MGRANHFCSRALGESGRALIAHKPAVCRRDFPIACLRTASRASTASNRGGNVFFSANASICSRKIPEMTYTPSFLIKTSFSEALSILWKLLGREEFPAALLFLICGNLARGIDRNRGESVYYKLMQLVYGGEFVPRQGLCRERVVEAAVALIEERGAERFSMGELAKRLCVKPASLYNHVESLDALLEAVAFQAIARLARAEEQAIAGQEGDAALFALAEAYRAFAREHNALYRVIMGFPRWNKALEERAGEILRPIGRVLNGYGLTKAQTAHWQWVLRGVMYGFAAHEQAGGFSHEAVDENESYRIAIQCVVDGLHRAGEEQHG